MILLGVILSLSILADVIAERGAVARRLGFWGRLPAVIASTLVFEALGPWLVRRVLRQA